MKLVELYVGTTGFENAKNVIRITVNYSRMFT